MIIIIIIIIMIINSSAIMTHRHSIVCVLDHVVQCRLLDDASVYPPGGRCVAILKIHSTIPFIVNDLRTCCSTSSSSTTIVYYHYYHYI